MRFSRQPQAPIEVSELGTRWTDVASQLGELTVAGLDLDIAEMEYLVGLVERFAPAKGAI